MASRRAAVSRARVSGLRRSRQTWMSRRPPRPLGSTTKSTSAPPTPRDTLLVVEVSRTTLRLDREVKLPLYAAAGITEYWIVDLEAERIEVHRKPGPKRYDRVQRLARGEAISPAALPDVVLRVDDILA